MNEMKVYLSQCAAEADGSLIVAYLGVKTRNGSGAWGAIVVATESNGIVTEMPISGLIGPSTGNHAWLVAAAEGMEYSRNLAGAAGLQIFSASAYLNSHANVRQLVNWALDEWVKPTGDPVANAEEWQRIYPLVRELSPTLSRPLTAGELSKCREAKALAEAKLRE